MEQLILHLVGDYVTQSDWMASQKTTRYLPAFVHATVYSLPFLLLRLSWIAFAIILGTHFLIDRFRLAKYVVWAKNFIAPPSSYRDSLCGHNDFEAMVNGCARGVIPKYRWENCKATGYPSEAPIWLGTWLLIIADNTMHLAINYLSLRYL